MLSGESFGIRKRQIPTIMENLFDTLLPTSRHDRASLASIFMTYGTHLSSSWKLSNGGGE